MDQHVVVETFVDWIAGLLLRGDVVSLAMGPVALVVAVPCALRLRRRGKIFWASSALLLASVAFATVGLLQPMVLIGPLAIPVVTAAAMTIVALPPALAALALTRRAQRGLEITLVLCGQVAVLSAASLAVMASASV
jgi:hypothetical protein